MAQLAEATTPGTSSPPSPTPLPPPSPPSPPLDAATSFADTVSSLGSFPFDSNPSTPTRSPPFRAATPPTPTRSPTPTPATRIQSPPPSPSTIPTRAQTEPPLNYAAAVTGLGRNGVTRSATAPSEQDGRSGSGSSKARTAGTGRKSFGAGMGGSNAVEEDGVRKVPLVLEKYTLYETKTKLYVIASNQADSRYRVLKIDRAPPPPASVPPIETEHDDDEGAEGLHVTEDAMIYSKEEIRELLETLSAGNVGGVTRVEALFYGIAGFVRFTSTYYMLLIKSRAPVALVGGHYIYHCEATFLKPVTPLTGTKSADEARLIAAFLGVDLSKNFYFSYTYNLTHTLQYNLTRPVPDPSAPPPPTTAFSSYNDMWVWNRHLLKPAFQGLKRKSPWVLPLIHGFVDQAKLSIFGRTVYVTLIARRSRHFAGARFLKRGVNNQGYVANDVETEQIVSEALTTPFYAPAKGGAREANPRYTSFVQVRGSIPLYWSQESINMSPKPPIELTIVDPYFSAAALHFDDLLGRYGGPITVLNLIKHKERAPRESKLLPEFEQCIEYLNQFLPPENTINYIPWDISAANKQRDKDVIGILEDIAEESLESTNFFHSGPEPNWYALNPEADSPSYRSTPLLQSGVIRTNCIDCLDRTNAAQFVVAKAALGHQLHALGIIHHPRLPFDSDAVNLITEMFHDHGDTVALQYGGSHLVNTMETYRKIGAWTSHSRDMIENLRRYYANSFVDADKQAAIDLFLGIEPSSPLPTLPSPTNPRRSYREWFTRSHVDSSLEPIEAQKRLAKNVEGDESYWQSYYRPKLFTEMARHFAFKVNSTDKYNPTGASGEVIDHSPFVPRLAAPHAGPRLNVGGVRRWMSHRGNNKTTVSARIQSQRIDESAPPDIPSPTTTEAIIARLLNPSVDVDEEREYASYIQQFEPLSLSQDLSEKDVALYRSNAAMARGEQEEGRGGVDRASLAVFLEAVRTGRPGQELRGSEVEGRE